MSTTTKKTTKKTTSKGLAGATKKKEELFYTTETDKKISKLGLFFRKMQKKPMVEIVDMKAVLK